MTERICPECGADSYRAAGYDALREARDRHWQKNRDQAIEILTLQLRVAELEEWQRTRNGKIERQRRGVWPHDDKSQGEGDPVSPSPAISAAPPSPTEPPYPSARTLRRMKRNREKATGE